MCEIKYDTAESKNRQTPDEYSSSDMTTKCNRSRQNPGTEKRILDIVIWI